MKMAIVMYSHVVHIYVLQSDEMIISSTFLREREEEVELQNVYFVSSLHAKYS